MKIKYIVLPIAVIILLFLAFIIFKETEHKNALFEETKERISGEYKIIDDSISVNISENSDAGDAINNMETNQNLKFTSSAFADQESIPSKYSCDGEGINPAFEIAGINENAKSLVLIMDDPDAPAGVWDHWIKFNIPISTTEIREGEEPEGVSGRGTGGGLEYAGPCPPDKEHHYFFKLYSLDAELTLPEGSAKAEVEKAMEGHILQTAELVGKYERTN